MAAASGRLPPTLLLLLLHMSPLPPSVCGITCLTATDWPSLGPPPCPVPAGTGAPLLPSLCGTTCSRTCWGTSTSSQTWSKRWRTHSRWVQGGPVGGSAVLACRGAVLVWGLVEQVGSGKVGTAQQQLGIDHCAGLLAGWLLSSAHCEYTPCHAGGRPATFGSRLRSCPRFLSSELMCIVCFPTKQETDQQYLELDAELQRDDGCTAVTAVLCGNRLVVAHCGDSRCAGVRVRRVWGSEGGLEFWGRQEVVGVVAAHVMPAWGRQPLQQRSDGQLVWQWAGGAASLSWLAAPDAVLQHCTAVLATASTPRSSLRTACLPVPTAER